MAEKSNIHPEIGDRGRYRVVARWASGGMADIFLARQSGVAGFDKIIALKVLREEYAEAAKYRDMFISEVRTAALLSHPNIVQTFDAGEIDGQVYMAMEFVHGEPLHRCISAILKKQELFPIPLSVEITRTVAEALHYAHTLRDLAGEPLQLVHRDISPGNIMLTYQGGIKLLDFGIAKASTAHHETSVGVIKGKWGYMPPEQAYGEAVDPRSDVFSLGLVLWEMLVGRRARDSNASPAALMESVNQQQPRPSDFRPEVDDELDAIVMRATAVAPADRYANAAELAGALASYRARIAPDLTLGGSVVALMQEHFGRRATRLTELLRQTENETAPSDLALLPTHVLHQTPLERQISSQATEPSFDPAVVPPAPVERRGRRRTWLFLPAVLAAVALGWWFYPRDESSPAPGPRRLTVSSVPAGADVLVDGERVGTTPLEATLPGAGSARITIQRRGYVPYVRTIGRDQESASVRTKLEKADLFGTLEVRSSPAKATVKLNGVERKKRTPATFSGLWVGESYEVTITRRGYRPHVEVVEFEDQLSRRVEAVLEATSMGFLTATCEPECEVFVDGESFGKTPLERHSIAADRKLEVELRRGGKVELAKTVKLRAGEVETVSWAEKKPTAVAGLSARGSKARSERNGKAGRRKTKREPGRTHHDVDRDEPAVASVDKSAGADTDTATAKPRIKVAKAAGTPGLQTAPPPPAAPPSLPRRRVPKARIGSPQIDGIVDRSKMRKKVRGLRTEVTRCYAAAFAKKEFQGEVSVRFVVRGDGRAEEILVSGSAAGAMSSCVKSVFSGARFPPSTSSDSIVRVRIRLSAR